MEASAFNANLQFENYNAYNNNNNMSGFTTEQSPYIKTTMTHGKKFNNSFNGIEFLADDLNDEFQVSDRHFLPDSEMNTIRKCFLFYFYTGY